MQERILKYSEALNEALVQAMDLDQNVFVMGCGVDDEGGIFGTTTGAFKKFGCGRVIDTPLSENAITGIGVGAAMMGKRPVIVHARNDFLLLAADQIVNHAAKWSFMSGGKLKTPVFVRALIGRGWGQAAQHSQSLQALFSHVPGLKVILPASAYDAKGLLLSSLRDDETVISIEHRLLYDTKTHVPEAPYFLPLGKGDVKRKGSDVTVVAFSYMVQEAMSAASSLAQKGIEVEVVDPRCSSPLDLDTILESVGKTRRLVIADTGWTSFGISAEVCTRVYEKAHAILDQPIQRIGLPHTNTPCSSNLEKEYYPGSDSIITVVHKLLGKHTDEVKAINPSSEHAKFRGPF